MFHRRSTTTALDEVGGCRDSPGVSPGFSFVNEISQRWLTSHQRSGQHRGEDEPLAVAEEEQLTLTLTSAEGVL